MKWCITRQRYWPDGQNVVEIAEGGRDYTNPDALAYKYPGEFQEFHDPREAVKAAVSILGRWNADGGAASLAYGDTGGYTSPFDMCQLEEAEAWAERAWVDLPKCDRCGDPIESACTCDGVPGEFCSEECADAALGAWLAEDEDRD